MSNHVLSLSFLAAAAAALFDWAVMPRWRTNANVRKRQGQMRSWSNLDRSLTIWVFVACAVLAIISFLFELQNA